MGWVRLDDAFYDHEGFAALELGAWGLWVWSLAWANRNLTDGKIPKAVIERMDPAGTAAGALITAGRWHDHDEHIVVHDYLDYQPSAAQVKVKRERERSRWQRRGTRDATPPESAEHSPDPPPKLRGNSAATPRASQPQPQEPPTPDEPAPQGFTRQQRAAVFAVLIALFGPATTAVRKSFYGKAVTGLLEAGATPQEAERRGRNLLAKNWDDCTPQALLKHWDTLNTNGHRSRAEAATDFTDSLSRGKL